MAEPRFLVHSNHPIAFMTQNWEKICSTYKELINIDDTLKVGLASGAIRRRLIEESIDVTRRSLASVWLKSIPLGRMAWSRPVPHPTEWTTKCLDQMFEIRSHWLAHSVVITLLDLLRAYAWMDQVGESTRKATGNSNAPSQEGDPYDPTKFVDMPEYKLYTCSKGESTELVVGGKGTAYDALFWARPLFGFQPRGIPYMTEIYIIDAEDNVIVSPTLYSENSKDSSLVFTTKHGPMLACLTPHVVKEAWRLYSNITTQVNWADKGPIQLAKVLEAKDAAFARPVPRPVVRTGEVLEVEENEQASEPNDSTLAKRVDS